MKKFVAVALSLFLLSFASPLAAQSYEGTSLEEGIFYIPADPGAGSVITFSATGFVPNSDVQIQLVDLQDNDIDGLTEVQGVVVVRADAAGNVETRLQLPAGLGAGTYRLIVTGTKADTTSFRSVATVQVAGATQTTGSNPPESLAFANGDGAPEALAFTGTESSNFAFGGLLLVGLGLGLIAIAGLRRTPATVESSSAPQG